MRLFMTRHAETIENAKGIIQSNEGGTLSDVGKDQADRLAIRIRDEHFDFIYSSDLKRASDTSAVLLKYHPYCSLVLIPELREADFGKYIGLKKERRDWKNVKGVESQECLQRRANNFYNKICKKHMNSSVLIVTHAGMMKSLTSVLLDKHYNEIWDMETPRNTVLSCFDIEADKVRVIYQSNVNHLMNI